MLDSWWIEGCIEGITGLAIGERSDHPGDGDAVAYDKVERQVLPLFQDRRRWIGVMKGAISHNGSLFTSHRMMRRDAADAYP